MGSYRFSSCPFIIYVIVKTTPTAKTFPDLQNLYGRDLSYEYE